MVAKKTTSKKEEVKHYMTVLYRDEHDKLVSDKYEMKNYNNDLSYKENVVEEFLDLKDEGGMWKDDKELIPFHRILKIRSGTSNKPRKRASRKSSRRNEKTVVVQAKRAVTEEVKESNEVKESSDV